jgi:hypothetical protein
MQEKPAVNGTSIEQAIRQLRLLPPDTQALVMELIGQLARASSVSIRSDFKAPLDNIPFWLTKLKFERKSERTVKLYGYLAKRFLKQMPLPTVGRFCIPHIVD